MMRLIFKYKLLNKEHIYCIYSEDLKNKKIQNCSLWTVYKELSSI